MQCTKSSLNRKLVFKERLKNVDTYFLVNVENKKAPSEIILPQCVLLVSTVVQLFDQKEVVEMTIRFQSLFEFYYQGWVRKSSLNESNSLLQWFFFDTLLCWWLMLWINWSKTSILKLLTESCSWLIISSASSILEWRF